MSGRIGKPQPLDARGREIDAGSPSQNEGGTPCTHQGCRGEKSVRTRNVDSIFSTSLPLASDLSRTLCHSGSSRKACQLAVAASRFGCARMYTRVLPLRGSSVGGQYAKFLLPCFRRATWCGRESAAA